MRLPSSAQDPFGTVSFEITILASKSLGYLKFGTTLREAVKNYFKLIADFVR